MAREAGDQSATQPPQSAGVVTIGRPHVLDPLAVAEETLRAIRNGEVDALVVVRRRLVRPPGVHARQRRPALPDVRREHARRRRRRYRSRDSCSMPTVAWPSCWPARWRTSWVRRSRRSSPDGDPRSTLRRDRRAGPGRGGRSSSICWPTAASGSRFASTPRRSRWTADRAAVPHVCRSDAPERAEGARSTRLGRAQAKRMRELEKAQAALTEQATHDALTGLPNRTLLVDRITQALAARRALGTVRRACSSSTSTASS